MSSHPSTFISDDLNLNITSAEGYGSITVFFFSFLILALYQFLSIPLFSFFPSPPLSFLPFFPPIISSNPILAYFPCLLIFILLCSLVPFFLSFFPSSSSLPLIIHFFMSHSFSLFLLLSSACLCFFFPHFSLKQHSLHLQFTLNVTMKP